MRPIARVLPHQHLAHAADRGADAGAAMLPELRPAGNALIGADLQERIDFPAAIDVEFVKLNYFHSRSPPRSFLLCLYSSAQYGRPTQPKSDQRSHCLCPAQRLASA